MVWATRIYLGVMRASVHLLFWKKTNPAPPLENWRAEPSYWQDLYITQLSYSINLILVMATGSIGFCISQLSNSTSDHNSHVVLKISIAFLMMSILCGVSCTLLRLKIFYKRQDHPEFGRKHRVGSLVTLQIALFCLGVLWLGIFYVFPNSVGPVIDFFSYTRREIVLWLTV